MNVSNLKVTLFMTDVFGVGWQESHYRVDASDPTQALSKYEGLAVELAEKRAACLHALFYSLTDVRLSYDNVFRDSFLVRPSLIPQPSGTGQAKKYDGGVTGSGGVYQTVQSAIPMILSMRAFKKRAINYMSGFVDSVAQHIRGTGTYPGAYQPFQNYGRYLCRLNDQDLPASAGDSLWGTKIVLPENDLGNVLPKLAVSSASFIPRVGAKGFIIHINSAVALDSHFAVGNTVYLDGWKMQTTQPRIRINGNYEIVARGHDPAPVNQDFIEVVKASMFVAPTTTTVGTIQGSQAFVLPYQNYTFRNATHHKRGKPSFEPRGRK